MQRWRVGDVVVSKLVELELAGKATWILPVATRENLLRDAWLQPHFVNERGEALMSVHAFVVESQGRRIVVDTCIGNDKRLPIPAWNQRQGPFLADLAGAGFPAESIDTVLCTHLHVDHVGWNTRLVNGRWVPTFANARYLWSRARVRALGHASGEENDACSRSRCGRCSRRGSSTSSRTTTPSPTRCASSRRPGTPRAT